MIKNWIYHDLLTSKLSWDLMINNTSVKSRDTPINRLLKRGLCSLELVVVTVRAGWPMGLGFEQTASSEERKFKERVGQLSEQDVALIIGDEEVQVQFFSWENTMQLDIG